MKRKKSFVLDENENKAVQLFSELGMPKNLAKTLLYISQVDERRRGWAKKRDEKKKGKGRPVHLYKLTADLPAILKSFEKEKMQEVESIRADLDQLHNLINSIEK
ncbi:MAG: ArsR family transcriptional regulator [Thermoplasmata archaeon M9B2D]|nr:MAG: ArsR family transcriptional regulator [Thermoplasmata archaeon M9B2D]